MKSCGFITSRVVNLVFAVRIGSYDTLFFRLQFMAPVLRLHSGQIDVEKTRSVTYSTALELS